MRDVNDSEDEEQNAYRAPGVLLSPPSSPDQTGRRRRSRTTSSSSIVKAAGPSKASNNDDPLADFYAKARAEAETEVSGLSLV